MTISNSIQKFHSRKTSSEEKKEEEVPGYTLDKTVIETGSEDMWLWAVATESKFIKFSHSFW